MKHSSTRIAALTPEKLALLAKRLKKETGTLSQGELIPRRKVANHVPLSFAQLRLWFLDQLEPGSSAYNIPTAVRLGGLIDVGALEQSFQAIIKRHESLRTTFAAIDGQPLQVIAPILNFVLPVVDLRRLARPEREAEALRLADEEAQRPFDLEQGPLLRASLLWMEEEECVLLLTMHHSISDGWSIGVFYGELRELYGSFLSQTPSNLPEPLIQYADYAVWQREWLQGAVLEKQLDYWTQQLAGAPEVLELPTDRPRPAVQSSRGAIMPFAFSRTLSQALRGLSKREGTTLFMMMMASFQTLLGYYSNSCDVPVGTNVSNRPRADTRGVIGFFVNQLVIRTNLAGDPTFREVLGRVREVALGAYAHQDVPFEKIVMALKPERNLSHQPLFQVKLDLQNAQVSVLELPGLNLSPLNVEFRMTHFDLTLSLTDTSEILMGFFQYSTDLFDATTIDGMLQLYKTLLLTIVAQPGVRLSRLHEILAEAEAQQKTVKEQQSKESRHQKLKLVKRKAIPVA